MDFNPSSFDLKAWIKSRPALAALPIDTLKTIIECGIKLFDEVGKGCVEYIAGRKPSAVYVELVRTRKYADPDFTLQATMDLAVEYPDEVYVLDWKTFRGEVEKHVKYKQLSMQPNVYAEFFPAKVVHFKFYSIQVTTKEIAVTPREPRSMLPDLASVAGQLRYLQESRRGMNFPTNSDSCFKYGRECPHYRTCPKEPMSIPGEVHDFPVLLRHSNLTEWYACPERFRRWTPGDDESEETNLGSHIHDLVGALMALAVDRVTPDALRTSYDIAELRRFLT